MSSGVSIRKLTPLCRPQALTPKSRTNRHLNKAEETAKKVTESMLLSRTHGMQRRVGTVHNLLPSTDTVCIIMICKALNPECNHRKVSGWIVEQRMVEEGIHSDPVG